MKYFIATIIFLSLLIFYLFNFQECPQCQKAIGPVELGVIAPKFGDRTMWHPSCFICTTCKELLVDLTYCVHDDLIYCERHYAEQLKPRCAACDEVSFIYINVTPHMYSNISFIDLELDTSFTQ